MNIFNTYVSLPEGKWKDPTTSDTLEISSKAPSTVVNATHLKKQMCLSIASIIAFLGMGNLLYPLAHSNNNERQWSLSQCVVLDKRDLTIHNIWLVVDLPLWKMMEFVSWDFWHSQLNGKS